MFELIFTPQADSDLQEIEDDPSKKNVLNAVRKTHLPPIGSSGITVPEETRLPLLLSHPIHKRDITSLRLPDPISASQQPKKTQYSCH
jgi:hypothetical protein